MFPASPLISLLGFVPALDVAGSTPVAGSINAHTDRMGSPR